MTLDHASLVWKRALEIDDELARDGDRHLSALLQVTGLEYNGGISHVCHCCSSSEIEAGSRAAEYFGLGALAEVLVRLVRLAALEQECEAAETPEDHERLEKAIDEMSETGEDLQAAYDKAFPDHFHTKVVFRQKLLAVPEDFAPLEP